MSVSVSIIAGILFLTTSPFAVHRADEMMLTSPIANLFYRVDIFTVNRAIGLRRRRSVKCRHDTCWPPFSPAAEHRRPALRGMAFDKRVRLIDVCMISLQWS